MAHGSPLCSARRPPMSYDLPPSLWHWVVISVVFVNCRCRAHGECANPKPSGRGRGRERPSHLIWFARVLGIIAVQRCKVTWRLLPSTRDRCSRGGRVCLGYGTELARDSSFNSGGPTAKRLFPLGQSIAGSIGTASLAESQVKWHKRR